MRWIVGLVGCMLSFLHSFAQESKATIQWMTGDESTSTHFFGGLTDKGYRVVSSNDSGHLLIRFYNINNQPTGANKGLLPEKKGNMFLLQPTPQGIVGFYHEKINKQHTVQVVLFNDHAAVVSQKTLEPALPGNKFTDLNFVITAKQTHVLVYTGIYNNKENRNEWNFAVYSIATGEWVNRGVYFNSYTASILESVQVDEAGRAFFISKQYKNIKDAMKARNSWYSIDVFKNGTVVAQNNFSLSGYDVAGVNMLSDSQGKLYLSGTAFPKESDKAGVVEGRKLFLYPFGESGTSYTDSLFIPMEKVYGSTSIKKEADIPVLLKKIISGANGEKILVAEQQQKIISSTGTWFTSNDIFCIRLNAQMELVQATRIPRLQESNTSTTFISGYWNKKVYLIGSDNKQNETAAGQVLPFSTRASNNGLFLYQVNEDGSFTRKLLTGYEIPDTAPVYFRCIDVGTGRFFLSSNHLFAFVNVSE